MVKTRINTDNNSKNHNRNAVFCSKRRHSSHIRQHLKTIHKEKPLENVCLNSFSSHTGIEDLGKLDTLFKTTRKTETSPVYIRSPATSGGSGPGQKRRDEGLGRRVTPYDGVSFREERPCPLRGREGRTAESRSDRRERETGCETSYGDETLRVRVANDVGRRYVNFPGRAGRLARETTAGRTAFCGRVVKGSSNVCCAAKAPAGKGEAICAKPPPTSESVLCKYILRRDPSWCPWH